MAVTLTPSYPAVGQEITLTADHGAPEFARYELTSKPNKSRLALGLIVDPHPSVVQTVAVPLTYTPRSVDTKKPATIGRASGSFVADGFIAEMTVTIDGTAASDGRVTVAAVAPQLLTLTPEWTFASAETVTSSLTGVLRRASLPPAQRFVADVPGEYQIAAYYYHDFTAPPMYSGDPSGGSRRELVGIPTQVQVDVGGYVELPIAPVNGHGATLRLLVVNETVRAAELANPLTETARLAALDPTVAAAVTALVGVTVANLDVDFVTDVNAMATKYEAHRILTGGLPSVHASADTTNAMLRETANSVPAAIRRLNDIAAKLLAHMEAGTSGGTWHGGGDDGKNTLQVAPSATTLSEAVVLKADLRERSYERHRSQTSSPGSHGLADSTNFMNDPLPLPSAIVAFLDYVAAASSAVAGEPEGIADAVAGLGFRPAA